jgi:hypothetical protein
MDFIAGACLPTPPADALATFRARVNELVNTFAGAEGGMSALRVKSMRATVNQPIAPGDVMTLKRFEKVRNDALAMLWAEALRFHGTLSASDAQTLEATIQRALVMLATGQMQLEQGAMDNPPSLGPGEKAIGAGLLALTWCFTELPVAMKILAHGEGIRRMGVSE